MRRSARDAAFSEYVVARRAQLRRTAYLLCGDVHQAEDLVQTALVKLYTAWPRATREGRVDAYVRRILVNAHIDETRKPWRRESPGLFEHDEAAPEAFEDGDALLDALRKLPEGMRKVVVLRHYWGLSVDETATDLGISPGTVKSQTSAALTKLEAALAPHFDGSER